MDNFPWKGDDHKKYPKLCIQSQEEGRFLYYKDT